MLSNSVFVAEAVTKPKYQLYSCTYFPAMTYGQNSVEGEIYQIDSDVKFRLDLYEGVDEGFYKFEEIELLSIDLVSGNYRLLDKPIYAYIFKSEINDLVKINKWP